MYEDENFCLLLSTMIRMEGLGFGERLSRERGPDLSTFGQRRSMSDQIERLKIER